jgi:hypothetical protein
MAAAAWKELRADRLEAEVLADIPPRAEGRSHGSDLQVPEHRASLASALRYQAGAGSAFRRAWRTFLELRKAKRAGLVAALDEAAPAAAGLPGTPDPEHGNCTNELSLARDAEAPAASVGVVVASRPHEDGGDERGAPGGEEEQEEEDPEAWLAEVPVVEADPDKEAERRRLLAAIGHAGLRKTMVRGSLYDLEQFHAIGDPDPTVYEEWFARQPKPEFKPIALSEEDRAAIRHVTRHNPPRIRGEYLGFYRKPAPRELFEAEHPARPASAPANDDAGPATAAAAPSEGRLAALRARVARLLDRAAERLPEELDLAEAVCALKWPKWPGYEGPVDLDLLRLALRDVAIDTETLNWLGGHEIAKECRAAATAGDKQPQGP